MSCLGYGCNAHGVYALESSSYYYFSYTTLLEPEFCFIGDTPHVEGNVLEVELQLLGCATVTCADAVEPFSEDCKCLFNLSSIPSC